MTAREAKMHAYRIAAGDCVKMAPHLSPEKVAGAMRKLGRELHGRAINLKVTIDRAAAKKANPSTKESSTRR